MHQSEQFYRMPAFVTLSVSDIARSIAWYQENLGFDLVYKIDGAEGQTMLAHLRYSKYADLLLAPTRNNIEGQRGLGAMLTFSIFDESVDRFAERLRNANWVFDGPVDRPWNTRELVVRDPDGYLLTFTQPLNTELDLDTVISNVHNRDMEH